MFDAVPAGTIEMIDVDKKPYFKRDDLGQYLGIADIRHNFKNILTKSRLQIVEQGGGDTPTLKQGQNWHDAFVSLDAALEITVRSKKPKAVDLTKWLARNGLEKFVEEKQQAIEEKDTQVALLNNDLTEAQRDIAILEHRINVLRRRAVPYLANQSKNNGMAVIQKNNGDLYPYVGICGQQEYVAQKIQNKLADYPNGQLVVLAETPNAIVHYNWLRERRCVVANPDRVRHFRLGEHYTHQRLMELQEA